MENSDYADTRNRLIEPANAPIKSASFFRPDKWAEPRIALIVRADGVSDAIDR